MRPCPGAKARTSMSQLHVYVSGGELNWSAHRQRLILFLLLVVVMTRVVRDWLLRRDRLGGGLRVSRRLGALGRTSTATLLLHFLWDPLDHQVSIVLVEVLVVERLLSE